MPRARTRAAPMPCAETSPPSKAAMGTSAWGSPAFHRMLGADFLGMTVNVEATPEAPHRILERARRAIGLERQNLAVEDQ